ncbi:hypothetical protein K458DRAFT_418054 [Lentithecium fluviatile CBS 122367]|uniref:Uncharacterized protein n=1 Tax=Lentithecium fluviatile CBS 122367 TaxID=1168545 RepID=A0A6G1J1T7_9PLEO|nr:hypothetical protein K458DRAFT_418054 [Lentithecium fluviatile CBS 122367]
MTSPTDPSIIPVGPYGRQMMDLQRIARSEDGMLRERGYFETANGRPETYHINQRYGPVEMDDTSRKTGNFI